MSYALCTLWHDRNRYLPSMAAVTFSALLAAMQGGLLLGIFTVTSMLVDRSQADIWIGYPGVLTVDTTLPIPEEWKLRLANQPEVERVEGYVRGLVPWGKPGGGVELCAVIGMELDEGSLGAIPQLTPELRTRLTETGAIAVDQKDLETLGLEREGDHVEVAGHRVRLVGITHDSQGILASYLYCSLRTARLLLHLGDDEVTYVLGRCRRPADVPVVLARLRSYSNMTAYSRDEFSLRTRLYWLYKTKAGIALGCAALLGLIVGAVVTSQTLYAATIASLRQFAVLDALGIPGWRMAGLVLTQSFWVGVLGVGLGLAVTIGLAWGVQALGGRILLPAWLLLLTGSLTLATALLSGLFAMRSLRQVEPVSLLR
jgi:putative ABC transport system permease protein